MVSRAKAYSASALASTITRDNMHHQDGNPCLETGAFTESCTQSPVNTAASWLATREDEASTDSGVELVDSSPSRVYFPQTTRSTDSFGAAARSTSYTSSGRPALISSTNQSDAEMFLLREQMAELKQEVMRQREAIEALQQPSASNEELDATLVANLYAWGMDTIFRPSSSALSTFGALVALTVLSSVALRASPPTICDDCAHACRSDTQFVFYGRWNCSLPLGTKTRRQLPLRSASFRRSNR